MERFPGPVRALILDLDGTLVDTFAHLADCFATALAPALGRRLAPQEVYAQFGPHSPPERVLLRRMAGGAADPAIEECFYRVYQERHAERVALYPGIAALLDAARVRGVRLGLLTGKGRRASEITLRELGLLDRFDAIVTGDEMPRPKPDPAGLTGLLEGLRVPPDQALFLGDSWADVGAGQAAGVRTVRVCWNAQQGEAAPPGMRPDWTVERPAQVLALLGWD